MSRGGKRVCQLKAVANVGLNPSSQPLSDWLTISTKATTKAATKNCYGFSVKAVGSGSSILPVRLSGLEGQNFTT